MTAIIQEPVQSVFEMFKVGVGPSSSHTVGPMRAGQMFVGELKRRDLLNRVAHIHCDLFGSLAATGQGHATDVAVILGLMDEAPATVKVQDIDSMISEVSQSQFLPLGHTHKIAFNRDRDITFLPDEVKPFHTNALDLVAKDGQGTVLYQRRYYSVGGGFVILGSEQHPDEPVPTGRVQRAVDPIPYPLTSAKELLQICERENLNIAQVVRANERYYRSDVEIDAELDAIWQVMDDCITRGLSMEGVMPGPFKILRRAKAVKSSIEKAASYDPLVALDWVTAWAFAVGEENACGGRVVTSPTNGAAGVIPAVIKYYTTFCPFATQAGVRDFLLTAGVIGGLYKRNASISGAEVGCQGEVGVACSMAAGGLAAVRGGTIYQVENAAEIGMEHHLGLTCDPVAGQVQIPCIERNAVAAMKAIHATRMSMAGTGHHVVSLDAVMTTMFETGRDMMSKYRETSRGGLAINVVQC